MWNAERLQSLLRTQLRGDQVIVVSNREPYIHERQETATGRASPGERPGDGGGAGDAGLLRHLDRARQRQRRPRGGGRHDRVALPPGEPDYLLRRIWLTEEQEQGYYYGFANEGLWPLCHVAHVRPVFREQDWEHYRDVNQLFADAVVAEARSDDPIVLVQDYHFALLPAMVRERCRAPPSSPSGTSPGPTRSPSASAPGAARSCEGMLGSTILGFHTRYHCKNFIETVDRYLEARIEHEHSTISFGGEETLVESYPISIEWPCRRRRAWPSVGSAAPSCASAWASRTTTASAVGVDRFDYTKGILERLNAVERMLEKHPEWRSASPSCRWRRPRAARSRSTAPSRSGSSAPPSASTRASAGPRRR